MHISKRWWRDLVSFNFHVHKWNGGCVNMQSTKTWLEDMRSHEINLSLQRCEVLFLWLIRRTRCSGQIQTSNIQIFTGFSSLLIFALRHSSGSTLMSFVLMTRELVDSFYPPGWRQLNHQAQNNLTAAFQHWFIQNSLSLSVRLPPLFPIGKPIQLGQYNDYNLAKRPNPLVLCH